MFPFRFERNSRKLLAEAVSSHECKTMLSGIKEHLALFSHLWDDIEVKAIYLKFNIICDLIMYMYTLIKTVMRFAYERSMHG